MGTAWEGCPVVPNWPPLRGNRFVNDIVHKAKITSTDNQKPECYIGLASGNFKTGCNDYNKSFRNERYEKDTKLSKFIWKLKSIRKLT